MGRLAILPQEVKSLHLMLPSAGFPGRIPVGPDFLIPLDSKDDIPDSLCSSIYPGTSP